ncbi:granulocyte colony-stimulating factor receptor isoform X2 [Triplophysa dalaica]|uniref:granulocyte colony-stimulating factor receptor isoform X2 n=1 Tax=Triplophysa dalaica TaxID=1582913 RepID=UPI0024E00EC4|nr:granulocyte colony-stimulating factor receptor isoform X2 [Triplophysa dalaica]
MSMASVWLSVFVSWIYITALLKAAQALICGEVNTSASMVAVGSSITASCLINNECPLTKGKEFRVEWKINNHLVPTNLTYLERNGTYAAFIPNILGTSAEITCGICVETNCQIVGGSIIEVKHPPPIPKNLSCVMTFSPGGMLCKWDPGQETADNSTIYTLHTSIRTTSKRYVLPTGVHFFHIPRLEFGLTSKMEIYVEVSNVFWRISSARLLLVPMESAKYGPPDFQRIEPYELGCVKYIWSLPASQSWVKLTFDVELSLKEVDNKLATELVFPISSRSNSEIKVCKLLHWTNYSIKMRVRYFSEWSEWSNPKEDTTITTAPSGYLDAWLKVPDDDGDDIAQLYWKPSQHFRANGRIKSYTVESKEPKQILCDTRENHCSFNLRKWTRRIYLTASNTDGSSTPTEIKVFGKKGLEPVSNISVHPQSESSVLIVWKSLVSSRVVGYVLEWRSLSKTHADQLFFTLLNKNQSSTVVTGLEPYKPYEISIYPKYVDGIGRCLTVIAYSKEKAPTVAPELMFGENHHSTHVHLLWDEIPLEQRNGIIRGYTIYVWDERNNIQILRTKTTDILVRHLQPLSRYNALISVHTLGGSLNGSVVIFKTEQFGGVEIVIFVIPVCFGFSLLILIAAFACLNKHERLKLCLWPIIPDPANSSIRRWTTTESLQGMPPFKEDKDPVMVYLSHFSLLDLTDKELCNSDYVKENLWLNDSGTHDEGHNLFQTMQENTNTVPYATVLFSAPYENQTASPPVYLRSDSTQPLLGVEDPDSPPPYENMSGRVSVANFFTKIPKESTGNEAFWEEFPMLRSLENSNTDHI